jgi:hypothetical protein
LLKKGHIIDREEDERYEITRNYPNIKNKSKERSTAKDERGKGE